MFLGYPYGIKGYKVLDLESNSIFISRDVIFYEHIFPYVASVQPSASYLGDFVFPHYVPNSSVSDVVSIPSQSSSSTPLVTTSTDSFLATPTHSSTKSLDVPLGVTVSIDLLASPIPLISSPSTLDPPVLRRLVRSHHPPTYLSNYSCKSVSTKPALVCCMMFQKI